MDFMEVWNRIRITLGIKNLNELAEIVGTSQPTVSRIKKEGQFPVEWAYKIGRRYNLLTEWIMEGTGPMRIGEEVQEEGRKDANTISLKDERQKRDQANELPINEQLLEINEWMAELPRSERLEFLDDLRTTFKRFDMNRQKKIRREENDKNIAVGDDTT